MELEPIKTSEYVRDKLVYKDGKLFWRESNGTNVKAGQRAGTMSGRGYRYIRIKKHKLPEHRVVWLYHNGFWPKDQIDHIDGNRANNSIENLREVDQSLNNKNQVLRKDNKSGYRGVFWYKPYNQWVVKISDRNKRHHLGYFKDIAEAISMRLTAESHYNYEPQRTK